jgi:hypothetical protein
MIATPFAFSIQGPTLLRVSWHIGYVPLPPFFHVRLMKKCQMDRSFADLDENDWFSQRARK